MRIQFITALITVVVLLGACVPIQTSEPTQPDDALANTTPPTEAPQPEPVTISRAADVPRISVDEAKVHYDNGTAVFVDSRSQGSYDVEHITGALQRPLGETLDLGNAIPKDQLIISYCT